MYICLASHLGRFLLREPNRSFKTTLGSTTRLRDIFMHVVLIKNTLGHEEQLELTKSSMSLRKNLRTGQVHYRLACFKPNQLQQSPNSVYRNLIITRRMFSKRFFLFNAQKLQTDAANCEIMLKTPSRHSFVKLNEVCLHILSFDENQDFDL